MVTLTIDKRSVAVPEGTTIMDAAASIDIDIPHICYLKGLNEIGACRVCVVEVQGIEQLIPSCNNVVQEGMVVFTNSPKVRNTRKTNVELLLSQHDFHCATCVRSRNCQLQTVAGDLGITEMPFKTTVPESDWPKDFPLIRNNAKCIKCMRCVQVCDKIQDLQIWDVANTGSRTQVNTSGNRDITDADCSLCGQCITHCPVAALTARDDVPRVFDALSDPDRVTIVQIAPAVRAAWGEEFGLIREFATVERLGSALRRIGFDYVFDTTFSADLTIVEEATEFLKRFTTHADGDMPMFTSCCPGWVRFIKSQYPELTRHLSTSKSPQQMFGAVAKSYYAEKLGIDPHRIFSVSIMPCTAKKHECALPTMRDACGDSDVDVALTTREVTRMIRAEHIAPAKLPEEPLDMPLGLGSGAGVIFGATGGVMEAALRSAYFYCTGTNPPADAFKNVRGLEGWKEATLDIKGTEVRVAVASGLANTRRLIEALLARKVSYDFVEIMACPGGCSGGGGQPIAEGLEQAGVRGQVLYGLDRQEDLRFSHENPSVKALYEEYLGEPLSERAEHLLHTDQSGWDMPLSPTKRAQKDLGRV